MVVVTSDHGFPVGEHGINHNEIGFYDDSFRVPFLLIWKGVVSPARISDAPASQLDIAPTLLHLLGLEQRRHHFQGRSLLDASAPVRPIPLIQPYNGTYWNDH